MTQPENQDTFRRAPSGEVVGSIAPDQLPALLDDLSALGVDRTDVEVLSGPEGLRILDPAGEHHGLHGRILRGLQQLGSEIRNIDAYADALRAGRTVVGIRGQLSVDDRADLLRRHGGTELISYGAGTAETL